MLFCRRTTERGCPPCFSREGSFSILSNFPFCIAAFFFFKFVLGIFIRGRIILHSWKFTFLWEWTTYFSIVSCPCWIKQKFLFKLSLPGEELACKLQLSEARVQVPLNSLKLKLWLYNWLEVFMTNTVIEVRLILTPNFPKESLILMIPGVVSKPACQVEKEGTSQKDWRTLLWHLV